MHVDSIKIFIIDLLFCAFSSYSEDCMPAFAQGSTFRKHTTGQIIGWTQKCGQDHTAWISRGIYYKNKE